MHRMSTLDHASHAIRRKGYAPHYAPGNLMQFQPEMQEPTLELISVRFSRAFSQIHSYLSAGPRRCCGKFFDGMPLSVPTTHA